MLERMHRTLVGDHAPFYHPDDPQYHTNLPENYQQRPELPQNIDWEALEVENAAEACLDQDFCSTKWYIDRVLAQERRARKGIKKTGEKWNCFADR